jgi:putative CocE/NonD family hydrolase
VTRLLPLAVALFALLTTTVRAAQPLPSLPPATYKTVSKYVMIPMDDGVRLGATITFPSPDGSTPAPGRFPVVLSMTPYGRDGVCGCPDQTLYSSRGFVQAVVDVRGTGGSGGNLDGNYFSPREQRDGYDLVEWFGTQPWSTGKVGMAGGSYVGITQYLTAERRPPHLAAIVPDVSLSDLYRDAYTYDGVPDIFFDGQYIGVQGAPGLASGDVGVGADSGAGNDTNPANEIQEAQDTASAKADQAQGTPVVWDYLARPNDDPWYHDRSPYYGVGRIMVPVLVLDGWHDGAFIRGDLEMYEHLARRRGVETSLYVDPCTHKGCGPPFDAQSPPGVESTAGLQFAFLAQHLRGDAEPQRPAAHLYLQPNGPYVDEAAWPPPATRFTRLYLDHGTLAADPPRTRGTESYFTDPLAGIGMGLDSYGTIAASPYVPTDQRTDEVQGLTWRTPASAQATRLIGPVALHLIASSSADDTDWVAKLSDVGPDGSETLITEGALRASHRALDRARSTAGSPYHLEEHPRPLTAGRSYAFDVAIIATAYELAPGHALQLRLTTDDMPTRLPGTIRFDRNAPASATIVPLPPATNTVHEGGRRGSYLLVPRQP